MLRHSRHQLPDSGVQSEEIRITGPDQLTLNSQLARTFRPHGKLYLDVSVNSTNTLNHAAFSSWYNYVTSTQFGLPASRRPNARSFNSTCI